MSSIIDGKKYLPTIGNFFKEKREKAGLSQDYVAMELDIARSNIPKYEKGDVDMPTSKLPEFCQLYRCRLEDCGSRVDSEMSFYEIGKDAVKSKFMDAQYMSFSAGTPMVATDYEVVEEQEFKQLIHAILRFRDEELVRIELPYEDTKRLRHNFAFFMVEFIKTNVAGKIRRERLLKLCNDILNENFLQ